MKTIHIHKFSYDSQTEVVSLVPPATSFTPMFRLVADENCFLTDGVAICTSVDVESKNLEKWHELAKSDYPNLF